MSSLGEQSELFPSLRTLDWLPDETLYSLASRHHRLSGNLRSETTARQLFGHARGGYPHDLPGGLGAFAERFKHRLGSSTDIALEHTVAPFFLLFRSAPQRADALDAMSARAIAGLKSRLGLPASRFGALCLLKACRQCMSEDRDRHGTPYWHREHQVPGIWSCPQHHQLLLLSERKRAGMDRFDWVLPLEGDLVPPHMDQRVDASGVSACEHIGQMILASIAQKPPPLLDATRIALALRRRLHAHGLASEQGRLKATLLSREYCVATHSLAVFPDFAEIALSRSAAYSQILAVIEDPASGHALRPLTVISWLFDTWPEFLRECELCSEEVASDPPPAAQESTQSPDRILVLAALGEGVTLSAAARQAGVEVATAQTWAAAAGIATPRRPSKVHGVVLSRLLADLRAGKAVEDSAIHAGISVSTARRIQRTHVGVYQRWKEARLDMTRASKRSAWLSAIRPDVGVGPSAARALNPAIYAWLHRNDRRWLMSENEKAMLVPRGNHSYLDWESRDQCLSAQCLLAIAEISQRKNNARVVRLNEILRLVPTLKSKWCHLDRLPLTASVLRPVLALRTATGVGSSLYLF